MIVLYKGRGKAGLNQVYQSNTNLPTYSEGIKVHVLLVLASNCNRWSLSGSFNLICHLHFSYSCWFDFSATSPSDDACVSIVIHESLLP